MAVERGVRGQALLAAVVAAGIAAACAWGVDGLSDTDPYRHLAYARELWRSGFVLRGHPFLPQTLLGTSGVDLWWGFHLLMIPFSFLGVLTGARVAGVCIAAVQTATSAWLGRRLGQRRAWLFALLPILLSEYFVTRFFAARPAQLTIPLVLLNLAAGAGELGPAWAGGAAFVHGLLHLSSPLSPIFAFTGAVGARIAGKPPHWRAVLYSVGGLALALVVRPDRAEYVTIAWVHNLGALGHLAVGHLPATGMELAPLAPTVLVLETWKAWVVVGLMGWLGRGRERSGDPAIRAALLLISVLLAVGCLLSARFLDYTLVSTSLLAAVLAPVTFPDLPRARWVALAAAVGVLSLLPRHIRRAWAVGNAYIAKPESFDSFAELIRTRVPVGTLLVSEDLLLSGVLYSYLPEYQYLCAYDPTLLYAQSPAQFWRWDHLVSQGRECPEPMCSPGPEDAQEVADAIRALGSDWFVSFYRRNDYTVLTLLHAHPELFELVGSAPARVGRLSLWRVRSPEQPR